MTLREFLELVTHLQWRMMWFHGCDEGLLRQKTRDLRWFSCFLPFLKAHGPIFGPQRLPRLPFPARLSTRTVWGFRFRVGWNYAILQGCPLKGGLIKGSFILQNTLWDSHPVLRTTPSSFPLVLRGGLFSETIRYLLVKKKRYPRLQAPAPLIHKLPNWSKSCKLRRNRPGQHGDLIFSAPWTLGTCHPKSTGMRSLMWCSCGRLLDASGMMKPWHEETSAAENGVTWVAATEPSTSQPLWIDKCFYKGVQFRKDHLAVVQSGWRNLKTAEKASRPALVDKNDTGLLEYQSW